MLQLNSDNMKNKGFTLVELIITIALIAIITVTIGVSMSGMLSRQEERQIEEYVENIENAACVYAETHNMTNNSTVTIDALLIEGLLQSDLTNPKTNQPITEYRTDNVSITWTNGEKKCEYTLPE